MALLACLLQGAAEPLGSTGTEAPADDASRPGVTADRTTAPPHRLLRLDKLLLVTCAVFKWKSVPISADGCFAKIPRCSGLLAVSGVLECFVCPKQTVRNG